MLSTRLLELIESHSEKIGQELLAEVRADARLPVFHSLPEGELLKRFQDACLRLSHWLAEADEDQIERRYTDLGRDRFEEGVPLHELVLAMQLFKRLLLRFARRQAVDQTAIEVYAEEELEQLIGGFFDRMVYHVVRGYEKASQNSIIQPA